MSHPSPLQPPNDYQQTAQLPAQPQYGQPAPRYGAPYTAAARARDREFGVGSIVWTLLGAIAAAVGLLAVPWTGVGGGDGAVRSVGSKPTFLDLRTLFVRAGDLPVPEKPEWTIAYFEYAAFLLLGFTLVLAVLAALPTLATGVFGVLGFVIGLISAAAAILVPKLDGGSLDKYLKGGLGLYVVAGGSLLMAVGALIGPERRT